MARLRLLLLTALLATCILGPGSASGYVSVDGRGNPWVQVRESQHAPHVIVYVQPGASVALRARPSGPVVERIGSTTPFGSPRTLAILRTQRGRWLGVTQPELGNARLGWVDARARGLRFARTGLELEVDLSSRTMLLRRGSQVVRRMLVGVGRPESPTPTGRFAVTDKLDGPSYSAYYGCCILALSATQPNLPAGWSGGDRIAIHGTPSSSDFGHAISAGCVHARDADLRYLMRRVPLGTPVVIRA